MPYYDPDSGRYDNSDGTPALVTERRSFDRSFLAHVGVRHDSDHCGEAFHLPLKAEPDPLSPVPARRSAPPTLRRVCLVCGADITDRLRASYCKPCADERTRQFNRQYDQTRRQRTATPRSVVTGVCEICGATYTKKHAGREQHFCSKRCCWKASRQVQKDKPPEVHQSRTSICGICGAEFTQQFSLAGGGTRHYCSPECSTEAHRRRSRLSSQRQREGR